MDACTMINLYESTIIKLILYSFSSLLSWKLLFFSGRIEKYKQVDRMFILGCHFYLVDKISLMLIWYKEIKWYLGKKKTLLIVIW